MRRAIIAASALAVLLAACGGTGSSGTTTTTAAAAPTTPPAPTTTTAATTTTTAGQMMSTEFTVSIRNVSDSFPIASSGVFAVPDGGDGPGPALPGDAYTFDVFAMPGDRLSFATMYVQSNDLVIATMPDGIPLYDGTTPISGDVTAQVAVWDVGTEIDQPLGEGADQAPRQAGPDTGAPDEIGTVRLVPAGERGLDPIEELVAVTVTPGDGGRFTVRIANHSDMSMRATPLAPGVYAVHHDGMPLFTDGQPDRGMGLETLAEDGDPSTLAASLAGMTGVATPLAPGVYAVHHDGMPLFTDGQPDRGMGLETLAEDGDPMPLAEALAGDEMLPATGVFAVPDGGTDPGPALPGGGYAFTITASPGDRLSFATMFVQSNDWFFATPDGGIALFDGETPISGDVTAMIGLWDAGTEVDQPIGFGPDQAPRQAGPNTGAPDGMGTVHMVAGGGVTVTITPAG